MHMFNDRYKLFALNTRIYELIMLVFYANVKLIFKYNFGI